ncbi:XdhC family protein [Hymenobacter canadensis]|uniref:XdhC family protein n=1 Tax=Hymenobacter canadensis TaxID=2999067 RepID=UPI003D9CBBAB
MSTLDFGLTVLYYRPGLPTQLRNHYAHHNRTVPYEQLAREVPAGPHQYNYDRRLPDRRGSGAPAAAPPGALPEPDGQHGQNSAPAAELRAASFDETALSRIHAPIGLPIRSRTPEEIAISVAAELIQARNGG